jgi:integrase/recombinase XerC
MPCHHNLEEYLTAYIEGAGLRNDPKGPLFRTIGRGTGKLTRTVLPQANAYAMIGRRAAAAGIATKLGNHSFRATGFKTQYGEQEIHRKTVRVLQSLRNFKNG